MELNESSKAQPGQEIISGSLWLATLNLAWPLFLNMILIAVASLVDVYVAGRIGSDSQAAIGVAGQIWFFMILLAVALSAGTSALVSRFWGEGDVQKTVEAARQSILFSLGFGIASAILGFLVCPPLLHLFSASEAVASLGWEYLKPALIGQIPCTTLWVMNAIFRGKGDVRIPMVTTALFVIAVIALDFGLCLYPLQLGIGGIGLSWCISESFGVALLCYALKRSEIRECLNISAMLKETSKEWFLRLMNIGIPACIQDFAWVGSNFVLFSILAQSSEPAACQAAWAVGSRVEETLGWFPSCALGLAAGTIIGQNLGAKQPERAERAGWQIAGLGALIGMIAAAVFFFGANSIAGLMSRDSLVIKHTVQYFQIVGVTLPLFAVWVILSGAMNGAGYTRWPMWALLICLVGIRLPLAWFLSISMNMGSAGSWYAIALSSCVCALIVAWCYRVGKWKFQKI